MGGEGFSSLAGGGRPACFVYRAAFEGWPRRR